MGMPWKLDKELSIRCNHGARRTYYLHTTTLDPFPNASGNFCFSFTNYNHKFKTYHQEKGEHGRLRWKHMRVAYALIATYQIIISDIESNNELRT